MDLRFLQMGEVRYEISPHCLLDKLLFEELTVDSGKWTVNVSTAWIYLKYIAEGDTTTVNCQLSTVNFPLHRYKYKKHSRPEECTAPRQVDSEIKYKFLCFR